jgi:5-(carboxyamino)imidazole ribonucleotide synthase
MPVLGILGGGQLGRMTALAAVRLGVDVRLLTPRAEGGEAPFAAVTVGDWTDPAVLARWAAGCDAVTVESEWAPADVLRAAAPDVPVWPPPETLRTVRHKGRQRTAFAAAGLPAPAFELAPTREAAHAAAGRLGWPVVLKKFEGSYDGYGNATCRSAAEIDAAWPHLAAADGLLAEAWAPFAHEAAVLVARRADGERAVYPVVRTEQRDHRLHAAEIPAGVSDEVEREAQRVALAAVEVLGAVGVVGVEVFVMPDGAVWLNEVAPRPHNTGHVTIEACHTSQFENHVRAVLGWPLGDPALRVPAAALVNVLGHTSGPPDFSGLPAALAVPGAAVHLYGKSESRPRRKMGHVTVTAGDVGTARARAEASAAHLRP